MNEAYNDLSLLSLSEACQMLRIGRETLLMLIKCGRIRCIQIGKRTKISYGELKRFIEESLFSNVNITSDIFFSGSDTTPILEFDTGKIFENIMEDFNNGKRI